MPLNSWTHEPHHRLWQPPDAVQVWTDSESSAHVPTRTLSHAPKGRRSCCCPLFTPQLPSLQGREFAGMAKQYEDRSLIVVNGTSASQALHCRLLSLSLQYSHKDDSSSRFLFSFPLLPPSSQSHSYSPQPKSQVPVLPAWLAAPHGTLLRTPLSQASPTQNIEKCRNPPASSRSRPSSASLLSVARLYLPRAKARSSRTPYGTTDTTRCLRCPSTATRPRRAPVLSQRQPSARTWVSDARPPSGRASLKACLPFPVPGHYPATL